MGKCRAMVEIYEVAVNCSSLANEMALSDCTKRGMLDTR